MSPTKKAALDAAFADMMDKKLRLMSEQEFANFVNGAVATVEACQKELERRALAGRDAGSA